MYEDTEAKTIGQITVKAPSTTGFNASISTIMDNATISSVMGTPSDDNSEDKYSYTLRCHDPAVRSISLPSLMTESGVSSFEIDSIRTVHDSWAESVTILREQFNNEKHPGQKPSFGIGYSGINAIVSRNLVVAIRLTKSRQMGLIRSYRRLPSTRTGIVVSSCQPIMHP